MASPVRAGDLVVAVRDTPTQWMAAALAKVADVASVARSNILYCLFAVAGH
jgi:hypothetical protein